MQEQSLEEVMAEVSSILEEEPRGPRARLYKEMLLNAIQASREDLDILDLKVINRAVAEFTYAARTFKPYRGMRKVSIFGSARTPEEDPYYQLAVATGRALAERGFMVITGAAAGIMRAGIEGAGAANSFGVNILLPFEAGPGAGFQGDPKLITFRYFFTRKIFFVMEAHACALFPGGFGTHDEGFEVLTLLQTGKTPPMPLVFMELPGERYWETWDDFVRDQLLARGYISPEDRSFYQIAHSPEEGAERIAFYYSTYHSMRQVGSRLVLRLERELTDDHLDQLTEIFQDLIIDGRVKRTAPLPPESDEPALLDKPRIAFAYNQRSAGRLNEMVLEINRMGQTIDRGQNT
jgi:uncharacterized protein (TIGR00730 family)